MYRLAHAAYPTGPAAVSGSWRARGTAPARRNGSPAADRDQNGVRNIEWYTSTAWQSPACTAFMALTIANPTGATALSYHVTFGKPRVATMREAGTDVPQTPSISLGPRPASRIAAIDAWAASESSDRPPASRANPVDPTPTIATRSLMG